MSHEPLTISLPSSFRVLPCFPWFPFCRWVFSERSLAIPTRESYFFFWETPLNAATLISQITCDARTRSGKLWNTMEYSTEPRLRALLLKTRRRRLRHSCPTESHPWPSFAECIAVIICRSHNERQARGQRLAEAARPIRRRTSRARLRRRPTPSTIRMNRRSDQVTRKPVACWSGSWPKNPELPATGTAGNRRQPEHRCTALATVAGYLARGLVPSSPRRDVDP